MELCQAQSDTRQPERLCCVPKGFSFLRRTLEQKGKVEIYLLVNRLFENIDARSDLDRSKYWSAASVLGETMILWKDFVNDKTESVWIFDYLNSVQEYKVKLFKICWNRKSLFRFMEK